MRNGFSLIIAIIFILVIGTIGALSLSLSSTEVKSTSDIFFKEQAKILAQSATEWTVMAMQAHHYPDVKIDGKDGKNCLENLHFSYPSSNEKEKIFDVKVKIYYLNNKLKCSKDRMIGILPTSKSNSHTALVDVTVKSTKLLNTDITYNRVTVQTP